MEHHGGRVEGSLADGAGADHGHAAPRGGRADHRRGGPEGKAAAHAARVAPDAQRGHQRHPPGPGPGRKREHHAALRRQRGDFHQRRKQTLGPDLSGDPENQRTDLRLGGRHHPHHDRGGHGAGFQAGVRPGAHARPEAPHHGRLRGLCRCRQAPGQPERASHEGQGRKGPRLHPGGPAHELHDRPGHAGRPQADDPHDRKA